MKIPKHRSNKESRLSINELSKLSRGRPSISEKRVNMLLECISTFFKWAINNGYSENNPIDSIRAIVPKRSTKQTRRPWNNYELSRLFSSPVYTGCLNERRRSVDGRLVIKDCLYWLPIVALYTGARLEELCQLYSRDLKRSQGIYYLQIKETEDENGRLTQRLKNTSSQREVPVHRKLIELGFIDWAKNHEHDMLFKIDTIGPDQKWSSRFSRQFGKYKRTIGINDTGVVFHSFRHNVMDFYKQNSADQTLVRQLVGHIESSLSLGRYSEKYDLSKMSDFVNQLEYEPLNKIALI